MEILIAGGAAQRGHGLHPEVIRIGADSSKGLFERDLDLKAQTVEPEDFNRGQEQISGHKNAAPPYRMEHGNKAHRYAISFDQEIGIAAMDVKEAYPDFERMLEDKDIHVRVATLNVLILLCPSRV